MDSPNISSPSGNTRPCHASRNWLGIRHAFSTWPCHPMANTWRLPLLTRPCDCGSVLPLRAKLRNQGGVWIKTVLVWCPTIWKCVKRVTQFDGKEFALSSLETWKATLFIKMHVKLGVDVLVVSIISLCVTQCKYFILASSLGPWCQALCWGEEAWDRVWSAECF